MSEKAKSELECKFIEFKEQMKLIIQSFKEEMKEFSYNNKLELYQIYKGA